MALVCGMSLWSFYLTIASQHFAKDFPQFYVLGRLALEHRIEDLQNGPVLSQAVAQMVSPAIEWVLMPIYGPQVALFFLPLGALPYKPAETLWLLVSGALYGLAVWRLRRDCVHLETRSATTWLLALAAPALFQVIWYGQLSMLAVVCLVFGLSAWERGRPFCAGLAFGVLAYKPQYGLALGIIFACTRAYPVIGGALVTGLGQLAIAWAYSGTAVMQQYAATLISAPASLDLLQSRPYLMQSLLPVAQLLPGTTWPLVGYGAATVGVLLVTYRVWSRARSVRLRQATLVLSGLLISPHLYVYDLVIVTPVLVWLTDWVLSHGAHTPSTWVAMRWSMLALYFWPVAGLVLTYYISFNFGPFIMLWLFGIVASTALSPQPRTNTP